MIDVLPLTGVANVQHALHRPNHLEQRVRNRTDAVRDGRIAGSRVFPTVEEKQQYYSARFHEPRALG
jgi:hypothetical protein